MADSSAGFIAPLVIRRFPWINSLPLKDLHKDGATKVIVRRLARERLARESEGLPKGKDILSHIVRDLRSESSGVRGALTEDQAIENVRVQDLAACSVYVAF